MNSIPPGRAAAPPPPGEAPGTLIRPTIHASPQRRLARQFQAIFFQVRSLEALARKLRTRIARNLAYAGLRRCIDAMLIALRRGAHEFAARALALGTRVARRTRPLPRSRIAQNVRAIVRGPAAFVSALLAKCLACGPKLCALMHSARRARDEASVRVA
jgi:hypothetical protein